ncbi:MAG: hypothetical protein ACFE0J_13530 [Elainellaceae cyanobacterium]
MNKVLVDGNLLLKMFVTNEQPPQELEQLLKVLRSSRIEPHITQSDFDIFCLALQQNINEQGATHIIKNLLQIFRLCSDSDQNSFDFIVTDDVSKFANSSATVLPVKKFLKTSVFRVELSKKVIKGVASASAIEALHLLVFFVLIPRLSSLSNAPDRVESGLASLVLLPLAAEWLGPEFLGVETWADVDVGHIVRQIPGSEALDSSSLANNQPSQRILIAKPSDKLTIDKDAVSNKTVSNSTINSRSDAPLQVPIQQRRPKASNRQGEDMTSSNDGGESSDLPAANDSSANLGQTVFVPTVTASVFESAQTSPEATTPISDVEEPFVGDVDVRPIENFEQVVTPADSPSPFIPGVDELDGAAPIAPASSSDEGDDDPQNEQPAPLNPDPRAPGPLDPFPSEPDIETPPPSGESPSPIEPPIEVPPEVSELDASGGQMAIAISPGMGTVGISNFGGIGRGGNPSQTVIRELDVLILDGDGLTPEAMLLTQQGDDLLITFVEVDSVAVLLYDFALDDLDNLSNFGDNQQSIGNIVFQGEDSIQNSFDVINSDRLEVQVLRPGTTTFLNDRDNVTQGFDQSADVINGQGGDDQLSGLGGNDILRGGDGDDILDGGDGNDSLHGGSGADQFVLASRTGTDTIQDFTIGDDVLMLSDGLTLSQIAIAQGMSSMTQQSVTHIIDRQTEQILAELDGINATDLTPSDFRVYA